MTSSDKNHQLDENDTLIDATSLAAEKMPRPNSHDSSNTVIKQESISSSQDSELKAFIERDSKKSNRHGNAIEKQQSKVAQIGNRDSSAAQDMTTEYEYHTDRILFVVVIGLLVVSFIGWGVYLLMSDSDSDTYSVVSEDVAATGTVVFDDTAAVDDVVSMQEKNRLQASLDELEAVVPGVSASEQPKLSNVESKNQEPITTAVVPIEQPRAIESLEKPEFQLSGSNNIENTSSMAMILDIDAVSRAHLARGVRQFEPVGLYEKGVVSLEGRDEFRLFWFTHLTGLAGDQVSHIWYYQGVQVAQVDMNIGSDSWRASTNKRISQEMQGQWRVEAVHSDGTVFARQSFEVVQ